MNKRLGMFGLLVVALFLNSACVFNEAPSTYGNKDAVPIVLLDGETTLKVSYQTLKSVKLDDSAVLQEGELFLFTPVEIQASKTRFMLDSIELPKGRYAGVRDAGTGFLKPKSRKVKVYEVAYLVKHPSEKHAIDSYLALPESKVRSVTTAGKQHYVVDHWAFKVALIPSKDNSAFKVALYDFEYFLPKNDAENKDITVPVIISVIYRYPDSNDDSFRQTSIMYEYVIQTSNGVFSGKPQLSNWLRTQQNPLSDPYSLEIVVAELIIENEEFYEVLLKWVKNIRSLI